MKPASRAIAAVAISIAAHSSLFAIGWSEPDIGPAPLKIRASIAAKSAPSRDPAQNAAQAPAEQISHSPAAKEQKTAEPKPELPKPKPRPKETPTPRPDKKVETKPAQKPAEQQKTSQRSEAPAQTQQSANDASGASSQSAAANSSTTAQSARPGTTSAPSGIVDVSTLSIVRRVQPQYPAIARKRREEGTAVVVVKIVAGAVVEARVERSSGHASLDEAALRASREWRFDSSSSASARIPFTFKIR